MYVYEDFVKICIRTAVTQCSRKNMLRNVAHITEQSNSLLCNGLIQYSVSVLILYSFCEKVVRVHSYLLQLDFRLGFEVFSVSRYF